MGRRGKQVNPNWKEKFLEALRKGLSLSAAAAAAGVSRTFTSLRRREDPEFNEAVQDAIEEGTDYLEDVAVRRAEEGSDTLLIFMLKSRRPEKYRDRGYLEHSLSKEVVDAFTRALQSLEASHPTRAEPPTAAEGTD